MGFPATMDAGCEPPCCLHLFINGRLRKGLDPNIAIWLKNRNDMIINHGLWRAVFETMFCWMGNWTMTPRTCIKQDMLPESNMLRPCSFENSPPDRSFTCQTPCAAAGAGVSCLGCEWDSWRGSDGPMGSQWDTVHPVYICLYDLTCQLLSPVLFCNMPSDYNIYNPVAWCERVNDWPLGSLPWDVQQCSPMLPFNTGNHPLWPCIHSFGNLQGFSHDNMSESAPRLKDTRKNRGEKHC